MSLNSAFPDPSALPMEIPVKQATDKPRPGPRKSRARVKDHEEEILRKATLELITRHGGHFVATGLRETRVKGIPVWIITVKLRFAARFEGYVGDLLYDGDEFTFLTEQSVIDERVLQIASDPEGIRKWHEERASTLRPRKT
jgi:hypothetical protein